MDNPKNQLQEFCQRNQLELPIYTPTNYGTDHEPVWGCEVSIECDDRRFTVSSKDTFLKKKAAEFNIASCMLVRINNGELVHPHYQINNIYFVDLAKSSEIELRENSLYICFINRLHPLFSQCEDFHLCETDSIITEFAHGENGVKLLYAYEGDLQLQTGYTIASMISPLLDFVETLGHYCVIHLIANETVSRCVHRCMETMVAQREIEDVVIENTTRI